MLNDGRFKFSVMLSENDLHAIEDALKHHAEKGGLSLYSLRYVIDAYDNIQELRKAIRIYADEHPEEVDE
jgi:hypothetical protein